MWKFFDSKHEKIVLLNENNIQVWIYACIFEINNNNFIKTTKNNVILYMDMIKTGELAGPKQNVCKHSKQH